MPHRSLENAWVAVQVKLNREKVVSEFLRRAGYDEFLPMYSPRPSSAIAARERPLFPGYLFCRYVTHISYRIVQAPGVIRLVGESHAPLPVDEDEITAIQRVVRSGVYNEPWRFAEPGARVRIRVGPLCGLAGTLVTVRNLEWLIISVTLLQRAIAVSVRGADVEILEPALAASL